MSTVATDYQIPTIKCGSKVVPHNNVKWSHHTNRHPNTNGSSWGWIEGPREHICWSNRTAFDSDEASRVIAAHNKWLESQKSLDVQLIEAKEKLDAAQGRFATIRTQLDEAEAVLSEASENMQRLIQIRDNRQTE